tara:strand:+ start:50 stop:163 length:114 start_codon:yes stop_codon:yes gene_type:complete
LLLGGELNNALIRTQEKYTGMSDGIEREKPTGQSKKD